MRDKFNASVVTPMLNQAKDRFAGDLSSSATKALERKINSDVEMQLNKAVSELQILHKTMDAEKDEALSKTLDAKERVDIEKKYEEERKVKMAEFKKSLDSTLDDLVNNAGQDIV